MSEEGGEKASWPTERGAFSLPPADRLTLAFRTEPFVRISDAVTDQGFEILNTALARLWATRFRKDIVVPQSGNSPRRMTVIGGRATNTCSQLVDLYRHSMVKDWCSQLVGFDVAECPNRDEDMIFTVLHRPGDTHGWHLDDYPIAFIIVLEMPRTGSLTGRDAHMGACLEVEFFNGRRSIALSPGDIYVMRADLLRHRVRPLSRLFSGRRVIANFTYARAGAVVHENGSADLLCRGRDTRRRFTAP